MVNGLTENVELVLFYFYLLTCINYNSIVFTEPSEPRYLQSVTYTYSDVMVTWREVGDPRGDVTDIVYVVDFRSADDDVTSCGEWSVNGSVKVTQELDTEEQLSTIVTSLCPATDFTFTVISWTFVFVYFTKI